MTYVTLFVVDFRINSFAVKFTALKLLKGDIFHVMFDCISQAVSPAFSINAKLC